MRRAKEIAARTVNKHRGEEDRVVSPKSRATGNPHKSLDTRPKPGPIWTPLIPASFGDEKELEEFGTDTLMERPGRPWEVATCFVFLASRDSSYITGQTLHVNGGSYIHG